MRGVPSLSEGERPFMLYSEVDGKCRNDQDGKVSLQHCSTSSLDGPLHILLRAAVTRFVERYLQCSFKRDDSDLSASARVPFLPLLSGAFELAFEPYEPYSWTVSEDAMLSKML